MPNIVVVGIVDGSLSRMIDKISQTVTEIGTKGTDGVITYDTHPYLKCCDMTKKHNEAPYLIVRDTKEQRAMLIAKTLNTILGIDVEVEVIRAFLPRKA